MWNQELEGDMTEVREVELPGLGVRHRIPSAGPDVEMEPGDSLVVVGPPGIEQVVELLRAG
jgi:hypothetical protein